MMRMKFTGTLLQAAAVALMVTAGVSTASAQTGGGSMAGMKMGADSKMDMKGKKAASKKVATKKHAHNDSHKHAAKAK